MLAIDTDLVVRYLTGDHPEQSAKARALIDGNDVFVATTVLLESEWVLRGVYGFERQGVVEAITAFAVLARVRLEAPAVVAKALASAGKGLDFADALHLAAAEGCEAFVSFDRRFVRTAHSLSNVPVRVP